MTDTVIHLTAAEAVQLAAELSTATYTARVMIQDGVVKVSLDHTTWSRGVGMTDQR